jgi:hypothetical protein
MVAARLSPLLGLIWIWRTSKVLRQKTSQLHRRLSGRLPTSYTQVKWLTLSSLGSILQSNYPKSFQRRRENVQQLALWSEAGKPSQELEIWEELDHEIQRTLIATLSRLISKAVGAKNLRKTQEMNHER